jgi:hypothetical protein
MTMPKVQLVVEFMNYTLTIAKNIPPNADCNVMKVNFFQGSCIFIFIIESSMSILEFRINELLSVIIEGLSPMEKTSLLLDNHLHNGICTPINDMNNIPIV